MLPYKPFGSPLYENYALYEELKGDALYPNKHLYKGCDFVISNMTRHPHFLVANLKLAQEFVGAEKFNLFPKARQPLSILEHVFGNSMVYMEGSDWRNRRKMFNKAFNFDTLKEIVPLIG